MTVRAKFKVDSVKSILGHTYDFETQKSTEAEQRVVTLRPVYNIDPNSENGKFYASTPSGQIELGVMNLEAAKQFVIGQEYFVDFTPAV